MSLLSEFLAITEDWRDVFPQSRTFQRAARQALGIPVLSGSVGTRNRSASGKRAPASGRGRGLSARPGELSARKLG